VTEKTEKPKLEIVSEGELDQDELEFKQLRRDLPGVKGDAAAGIVSISVGKTPGKNEFFRTSKDFHPVVALVNCKVGLEQQYFAVSDDMIAALAGIGITTSDCTLYLTATPIGSTRIIPILCDSDNDYNRTKESGLIAGMSQWVRLYTDMPNRCYRWFPAPAGRFPDPIFPELKPAKIFRGMQHATLAQRLGISTFAAAEMLAQHHALFGQYWAWVEDWIAHALDTGLMRTPLGWKCRTGITEFNPRSIGNWPTQAASADIMRVACVMGARHGIELIGSVHDALVIEAPLERIDADVALTREIMRRASRIVLNPDAKLGPHELRTDATIVRYPVHYTDKRGVQMRTEVLDLLAQYRQHQTEESKRAQGR
jgi:hypothetical protein